MNFSMNFLPILTESQVLENLKKNQNPFFQDYLAFYSSWLGGVVTDPHLMLVPMDDHMVTRGDGVFETMKSINRGVYLLDEHLDRFWRSAKTIYLEPPMTQDQMKQIILNLLKIADYPDTMIRAYLSRGPGNFSVNPYESVGPQFYLAITKLHPTPQEKYTQGVSLGLSQVPAKPSWLAQVKSCNYLPNVLMRKEAVDRHFDYIIGLDPEGFITEGPTENFMMLDKNNVLTYPMKDFILRGTTLVRLNQIAEAHGLKTTSRPIQVSELKSAQALFVVGTSFGILPIDKFEETPINQGVISAKAQEIIQWILQDTATGPKRMLF